MSRIKAAEARWGHPDIMSRTTPRNTPRPATRTTHHATPNATSDAPPIRRLPRRPLTGAAHAIAEHPPQDADDAGLVAHPDGWYWEAPDGLQQFGPFETAALARADRDRPSEESVDESEAEREAEVDLGVADAIDEERHDGGPVVDV